MRANRILGILAIAAAMVGLAATTGSAAIVDLSASPIAFAGDSDYNNATSQTTGVFRDFLNGSLISRGDDLRTGTGHTALNFSAGTATTVYDTTPSDATAKNLFYGTVTVQGDFLTHGSDTQGGGLLAVFNEGTGLVGVSYRVSQTGSTSPFYISKIAQNGAQTNLSTSSNTAWADEVWYRMVMTVTIDSSSNITITGRNYNHSTTTDPDSAVGTEVTLAYRTYTSTLSAMGLDSQGKGEVGLFAYATQTGLSVTHWSVTGNDGTPVPLSGGPYSVASGGNVALAGTTGTGSYGTIADANWLWDLDNDGLFDDATGQNPTVSYDYLVNTLHLLTDGVARPIGVQVTNNVSLIGTAAGTLSITPEPATMTLLGLGGLAVGWSRIRGRKRRAA